MYSLLQLDNRAVYANEFSFYPKIDQRVYFHKLQDSNPAVTGNTK